MHLLSDASVPAHVRDNTHLFGDSFESWTKANWRDLTYCSILIGSSIFNRYIPNSLAPVPISALWDQDSYNGANPPDPANTTMGIAEYTNANFFSDDSVFIAYPHPGHEDTNYGDIDWKNPEKTEAEDGKIDNRIYIKRVVDGESLYRLASVSYVTLDCQLVDYPYDPLVIDHKCHQDYSEKLIPRAVGYSSGLLDYFFRGKLEVELEDGEIKITNKSEENMHEGTFELYYDNEQGQRQAISINSGAEVASLDPDEDTTITFDPPSDFGEDKHYITVYRGALGNETDAVVGKVVAISKPYLLVTIAYPGKDSRCFIWNIERAQLAEIEDSGGNPITWPCDPDDLSGWLDDTISIGEQLYNVERGGESFDLSCSCVISCSGEDSCCGWSPSGSCSKTESKLSLLKDVDGSDLTDTSYVFREAQYYYVKVEDPVDGYCCHGNSTLIQDVTMEAKKNDLFGSFWLGARNRSGIVTTARTKKKYEFYEESHLSETGECCYYVGYSYFEGDSSTHTTYTFLTPLGVLGEAVFDVHNYYLDVEGGSKIGNTSAEIMLDSLSSSIIEGIYSTNAIAQVYLYQYVKQTVTWPDCGVHPYYGLFPEPCDAPVITKGDRVILIHAQVDEVIDGNTQNPKILPRNETFENAIRNTVNNFYHINAIGDDEICKFSMALDVRH